MSITENFYKWENYFYFPFISILIVKSKLRWYSYEKKVKISLSVSFCFMLYFEQSCFRRPCDDLLLHSIPCLSWGEENFTKRSNGKKRQIENHFTSHLRHSDLLLCSFFSWNKTWFFFCRFVLISFFVTFQLAGVTFVKSFIKIINRLFKKIRKIFMI